MAFEMSDGTRYERMNDGSVRRDPPKVGGRERKRLRKLRRRGHHGPNYGIARLPAR